MRWITGIFVAACLMAGPARAQVPSGNIFLGYSYTGADVFSSNCNPACPPGTSFLQPSRRSGNFNGFDGQAEGKFLPFIGIVADVGRQYGSASFTTVCNVAPPGCPPPRTPRVNANFSSIMFGPRVSVPIGRVTPFAHALFGAGHISDSRGATNSDTAFVTAIGGGLDFKLIKGLAWRFQGDELHTRFFGSSQDHFRFSTGIVLRF
jgi:hypothetical protein